MATTKASPKTKSAPKTVAKKAPSTKVAAPKKATPKKAAMKKASAKKTAAMSGFERYKMIEVAAYYMAEKNGFAGNAADYWIAAEVVISKKR
jgi:Protein of unknown function (DUF2934)